MLEVEAPIDLPVSPKGTGVTNLQEPPANILRLTLRDPPGMASPTGPGVELPPRLPSSGSPPAQPLDIILDKALSPPALNLSTVVLYPRLPGASYNGILQGGYKSIL